MMKPTIHFGAFLLGTSVQGAFSLSIVSVHHQHHSNVHNQEFNTAADAIDMASQRVLNENAYQSIAALRSDSAMSSFAKRLLAAAGKYIPQDQEGELTGFVQWFDGTNATQSFHQMQEELFRKSWVKDLTAVDGANLSEEDYQSIAALQDDSAMTLLVDALLKAEGAFVPPEEADELAGFVPWFSGTKAVQNLEQLRLELFSKPWVHRPGAEETSFKEEHAAAASASHKTNETSGVGANAIEQSQQLAHVVEESANHGADKTAAEEFGRNVTFVSLNNQSHAHANSTADMYSLRALRAVANQTSHVEASANLENITREEAWAAEGKGHQKDSDATVAKIRIASATAETASSKEEEEEEEEEDEETAAEEVFAASENTKEDEAAVLAEEIRHQEAKAKARRGGHGKAPAAGRQAKRKNVHEAAAIISDEQTDAAASLKQIDATAAKENVEGILAAARNNNETDAPVLVANAPAPKCADCIVWGDVKILSFNAYRHRAAANPKLAVELSVRQNFDDQFSVAKEGTYWLVNNDKVQIQGRYWRYNWSRPGLGLGALAIGGPIVGNNILVIRAQRGNVTWNGKDILNKFNTAFANDFVTAHYISSVRSVAGDTHAPGIKLIFSSGVRLTVARYREKLAARLTLCESDAGAAPIGGHCGDLQEETPRGSAREWLAMQTAVQKLPKSNNLFQKEYQQP